MHKRITGVVGVEWDTIATFKLSEVPGIVGGTYMCIKLKGSISM